MTLWAHPLEPCSSPRLQGGQIDPRESCSYTCWLYIQSGWVDRKQLFLVLFIDFITFHTPTLELESVSTINSPNHTLSRAANLKQLFNLYDIVFKILSIAQGIHHCKSMICCLHTKLYQFCNFKNNEQISYWPTNIAE